MLLRAAPWPAVSIAAACGTALGAVGLAVGGGAGLRTLQLSWLVLAAGAAFALDEPAAAAVAACPLAQRRRLLARGVAAVVPLLSGLLLLSGYEHHSWRLALQLAGCSLLAFGAAAIARLRLAEPGDVVSTGVALSLAALVVYEPAGRAVPLFAATTTGTRIWLALIGVAVIGLVAVLRPRRWPA